MTTKEIHSAPAPLMTIDDLAAYLSIPKSTIYVYRHQDSLPGAVPFGKCPPAIKVGGHLRWRRSDVEEWLTRQKEQAA